MANENRSLPKSSIVEVSVKKASETDFAKRVKEGGNTPSYTIREVTERFVTISKAKEELDLGYTQYVRRLLKAGDLEGLRVKVKGGTRWLVSRESISRYSKKRKVRGDLRNYTLRINPELEERLREFLKSLETEYELELQYKSEGKGTTPSDRVWASVLEALD